MTNEQRLLPPRLVTYLLLVLVIACSLPIKLMAAHNMSWDIDYVPVVSRLAEYRLPPVGTLSSVAAYNMPMLEWLHLPAWLLTGDVYWSILLTMLTFNILSTIAIFCVGDAMVNERAGLAAAMLFTFSEVGVSSAYTAWAQLLLPGFYAMTLLFLWEWHRRASSVYLALAGVAATAAFMTHFSAILLYPAMLIIALLIRSRWQWRGLLVGAVICLLMLAPYLAHEAQHDFVDIRAFLKQEVRVTPEVMQQVRYLKPESGPLPDRNETVSESTQSSSAAAQADTIPRSPSGAVQSRWQRARAYVARVPRQVLRGLSAPFDDSLDHLPPDLARILRPLAALPELLFIAGSLWAVGFTLYTILNQRRNGTDWQALSTVLLATVPGRLTVIVLFTGAIIGGLIVTRSTDQTTYYMGLASLQIVIAGSLFGLDWPVVPRRAALTIVLLLLIGYAGINTAERTARLLNHDDNQYSRYNVSLYRHVADAVDFIAEDWQGGAALAVSYDIMPEMRNLWWVAAWHSIDPGYRMGMNFDFLLESQHGLMNTNTDPIGYIPQADYIVVYEPGLARFELDKYILWSSGTIYVLKPVE